MKAQSSTFFAHFGGMLRHEAIFLSVLLMTGFWTNCSKTGESPTRPGAATNSGSIGEKNFAALIRDHSQGRATKTPWAGYWWPYSSDGISDAASKYEKARGDTQARAWEILNHGIGAPSVLSWFGHCNGWAAAAVLFPEPASTRNISGVEFSVADQKALLTEIGMEVSADYFGLRATSSDPTDPAFEDIFPDQFFLVMTNFIGKGWPVVLDRYTGEQVWNQPIAGYQISPIKNSDYLGADPQAPGVFRMNVTLQLWWVRDDVDPNQVTEDFAFADSAFYESRTLRMEIWFDGPARFSGDTLLSSGNIILSPFANTVGGGAWNIEGMDPANSHPDYLWIPHALTAPSGYANPFIEAAWVRSVTSN